MSNAMMPKANALLLATAAAVTIKAKAGKPAKVEMLAYSGGIMSLPGHGPVVVDLEGLEYGDDVPALVDHENRVEAIVGNLTPQVRQGKLYADGTLSEANDSGQRLLALHRDGVKFQASIGAVPLDLPELVRPGDSIVVNGQTQTAPAGGLKVFRSTELREITLCANGADSSTSVSIKATLQRMFGTRSTAKQTNPGDNQRAAERIQAAATSLGSDRTSELLAKLASGELDPSAAEDCIFQDLNDKANLAELRASRPLAPANYSSQRPHTSNPTALEASLAAKVLGESYAEKTYGAAAMEAAQSIRAMSSVDACLAVNGISGVTTRSEKISAAMNPIKASQGFSTISLPVALGNVANKALSRQYQESTATWRKFCGIKTASNFHEQTSLRPSTFSDLQEISAQGQIKHSHIEESDKYVWRLASYAKMINVSRQHLINDDLGFIESIVSSMGPAAMRTLSQLVYDTLKAEAGGFFSADNGNLSTSNPLSSQGFANAIQKMREQTDENGNYIDTVPATLVVAPALEKAAKEILQSDYTERVATAGDIDEVRGTGNPHKRAVILEVEPRLTSAPNDWYLFARPELAPMVVGFLDGKQAPTVEFLGMDSQPGVLGVAWRVYHDFGVALGDGRAAQKNEA